MTPEGKIKAYLVKLLNKCGITYIRNNSGMGSFNGRMMITGCRGAPDFSIHPGKGCSIWVEVKSPRKRHMSEAQLAWKEKTGHTVYLINSKESVETLVYCMYHESNEDPSFLSGPFAKSARNGNLGSWSVERQRLLDSTPTDKHGQEIGWEMARLDSVRIGESMLLRGKPTVARGKGPKS